MSRTNRELMPASFEQRLTDRDGIYFRARRQAGMGKYGLGGLCLGLGATILLGSVRDWWPSMPDLASYYLTVAGFELVAIGLFCLVAGFTEHRSGVAYDLYNRLINVLQSLWNGAFIPASAFAIFVVIPLTIDEVHSSGKYVYVLFEYPSLVDYSSDTYSVNYLITNDTDSPITLSDFKLLNISTNSKIY